MQLTLSVKIGTPLYMAPELLSDRDFYGPSIDVCAFGLLDYQLVTWKEPYSELRKVTPYIFIKKVLQKYRSQITKLM